MYVKSLIFGIAMVIFLLPARSHAQSRTSPNPLEDFNPSAFPNGSIVVISEEETGVPGYVHTKYAFVDQACGAQIVDHYGPPVDPNDKDLLQSEKRKCTERAMDTHDGD